MNDVLGIFREINDFRRFGGRGLLLLKGGSWIKLDERFFFKVLLVRIRRPQDLGLTPWHGVRLL